MLNLKHREMSLTYKNYQVNLIVMQNHNINLKKTCNYGLNKKLELIAF